MDLQRASINLRNILDVSEKEQLVSMETTLRLFWKVRLFKFFELLSFSFFWAFLSFELFDLFSSLNLLWVWGWKYWVLMVSMVTTLRLFWRVRLLNFLSFWTLWAFERFGLLNFVTFSAFLWTLTWSCCLWNNPFGKVELWALKTNFELKNQERRLGCVCGGEWIYT